MQKLTYNFTSETRNESEAGIDIDPRGPINWGAIAGKQVQYQIQHRYIFEDNALSQALSRVPGLGQLNTANSDNELSSAMNPLQIGQMAAKHDLTSLLGCTPTCLNDFTYEKWLEVTTDLQPGLDLGFTALLNIELGSSYKVGWGKEILLERGIVHDGDYYPTEVYTLDSYVDAPERSLTYLIGQTLESAFAPIANFFNTVTATIQDGLSWLVNVAAQTGQGIIQGGLSLSSGSTRLAGQAPTTVHHPLAPTNVFTLTATAWTPTSGVTATQMARSLNIQMVDSNFIVGGAYDLQPYTQTLSSPATMVIT